MSISFPSSIVSWTSLNNAGDMQNDSTVSTPNLRVRMHSNGMPLLPLMLFLLNVFDGESWIPISSHSWPIWCKLSRFSTRTWRFVDAYHVGLSGARAAWASRVYRGHRMFPENIVQEAEKAIPGVWFGILLSSPLILMILLIHLRSHILLCISIVRRIWLAIIYVDTFLMSNLVSVSRFGGGCHKSVTLLDVRWTWMSPTLPYWEFEVLLGW